MLFRNENNRQRLAKNLQKKCNHHFEGKTSNRDAKSQESDTRIIRGNKMVQNEGEQINHIIIKMK